MTTPFLSLSLFFSVSGSASVSGSGSDLLLYLCVFHCLCVSCLAFYGFLLCFVFPGALSGAGAHGPEQQLCVAWYLSASILLPFLLFRPQVPATCNFPLHSHSAKMAPKGRLRKETPKNEVKDKTGPPKEKEV